MCTPLDHHRSTALMAVQESKQAIASGHYAQGLGGLVPKTSVLGSFGNSYSTILGATSRK